MLRKILFFGAILTVVVPSLGVAQDKAATIGPRPAIALHCTYYDYRVTPPIGEQIDAVIPLVRANRGTDLCSNASCTFQLELLPLQGIFLSGMVIAHERADSALELRTITITAIKSDSQYAQVSFHSSFLGDGPVLRSDHTLELQGAAGQGSSSASLFCRIEKTTALD